MCALSDTAKSVLEEASLMRFYLFLFLQKNDGRGWGWEGRGRWGGL